MAMPRLWNKCSSKTLLCTLHLQHDAHWQEASPCSLLHKADHEKAALHAFQPPNPLLNNLLEGEWTLDCQCLSPEIQQAVLMLQYSNHQYCRKALRLRPGPHCVAQCEATCRAAQQPTTARPIRATSGKFYLQDEATQPCFMHNSCGALNVPLSQAWPPSISQLSVSLRGAHQQESVVAEQVPVKFSFLFLLLYSSDSCGTQQPSAK